METGEGWRDTAVGKLKPGDKGGEGRRRASDERKGNRSQRDRKEKKEGSG